MLKEVFLTVCSPTAVYTQYDGDYDDDNNNRDTDSYEPIKSPDGVSGRERCHDDVLSCNDMSM